MRATIDKIEGVSASSIDLTNASIDNCIDLLKKLDGGTHTILSLQREDGSILYVGGGGHGYVVTITTDDGDNYIYESDSNATGDRLVNTGGQFGRFSIRNVIRYVDAEKLVRLFFQKNELEERGFVLT